MKNELKNLIGFKMVKILFGPTKGIDRPDNMFELVFEKEDNKIYLNVICFLRIMMNDSVLLTSSDEYVDTNYRFIKSSEISAEELLVYKNIFNVQQKSFNAKVKQVILKECGDVLIRLSNNIIIEIIIDCVADGYECYRLLDNNNCNSPIVAEIVNGQIHYDYTGCGLSPNNEP